MRATPFAMFDSLTQRLSSFPSGVSEVWNDDHNLDPVIKPLLEQLSGFTSEDFETRQKRVEIAQTEIGIHFSIREPNVRENHLTWGLDLLPRIIRPAEWESLSAGLLQRCKAYNLFLADIFHEQRILRERVIPHEIVLGDPAYLRECFRLPVPRNHYIVAGAVDLVRTEAGKWMVSHNHYSAPTGISFILQHRRILTQVFPEIFESYNVQPISSFATQLVEALSALSDQPNPHIVLLNRAETNEDYFEESFLARRMGIAMVRPDDLLVRESNVYLKTVAGLEKIDVIYRRVGSASIDPIAFGFSGFLGIPGLVNCVRKGNVVIGNALGCGLADNKALLRYADRIIRFYLNEEPLLETIPTYHCSDPDQAEYVRQNLDKLVLKPVHRNRETARLLSDFDKDMHQLLKTNPAEVVAQPRVFPSLYPRLGYGRIAPSTVYLRAFTLMGDTPCVLPGGLTRASLEETPQDQMADEALGCKDTWVLSQSKRKGGASKSRDFQPITRMRQIAVSSRVAESLYWIGRYTERAENTSRMLRVLEEARWEELGTQTQASVWPLWQAVAASTGQMSLLEPDADRKEIVYLSRDLLLKPDQSGSAIRSIAAAYNNAQAIREFITPEFWTVLNRLHLRMQKIGETRPSRRPPLTDVAQMVVDEIACLNGTAQRTMPHDDGWQFFKIGNYLERAICTVSVLEIVLPKAAALDSNQLEENPDLTTLLRLLGSLDAYRREFRSRAYSILVAELLWKNEETPSSVACCCRNLVFIFENILKGRPSRNEVPVNVAVRSVLDHLRSFSCRNMFPSLTVDADNVKPHTPASAEAMRTRIERQSANLKTKLERIHLLVEDAFFSHQNEFNSASAGKKEIAA